MVRACLLVNNVLEVQCSKAECQGNATYYEPNLRPAKLSFPQKSNIPVLHDIDQYPTQCRVKLYTFSPFLPLS